MTWILDHRRCLRLGADHAALYAALWRACKPNVAEYDRLIDVVIWYPWGAA